MPLPKAALAGEAADQAGRIFGEDQLQVVVLRAMVPALEDDETRALELMAAWDERSPGPFAWQAYVYLALAKETDVLERAYHQREEWLPNMTSAPQFDPIRNHPRFRALREAMGLPVG